jgi:L-ornithine N5-oxygenase
MGPRTSEQGNVYDVVGIGFGPSNLALAIALWEYNHAVAGNKRLSYRFVERNHEFAWHRNMLLPDADMQISFLKDLVTPRNPVSGFSFIAYLHEKGRLAAFTNQKVLFPSRQEYHNYLQWASCSFEKVVDYGYEATSIRLADDAGPMATELWLSAVNQKAGDSVTWRAHNVVVATGLVPWLPDTVKASNRVWHSEDFLERLSALPFSERPEFVVVGAGQSAAEVTDHLLGCFPHGQVHAVMSRYGYSPADSSPFANEIFDAGAVEEFFYSPDATKRSLLEYHSNTNYSVVDQDLIESLYRRYYRGLVNGESRMKVHRTSRVSEIEPSDDKVTVTIESMSSSMIESVDADAVVYASGYRPSDPMTLLKDVAEFCSCDETGQLRVGLDYRVEAKITASCGIFLQGLTERVHGLTSSLLSNVAVRAGEIVNSVVQSRARQLVLNHRDATGY